jgi:hypothetical protein
MVPPICKAGETEKGTRCTRNPVVVIIDMPEFRKIN